MKRKEIYLAIAIIAVTVAMRFLPHMPNFVPITAICLFGGRYFKKLWAFLIPISAMLISDIFLGFSDVTLYVYGGLLAAILIGILIKKNPSWFGVAGGTLVASIIFFLITNFGVWQAGWYGHTLGGLILCYEMAIPFFRNSLAGDLFYVAVIFGTYELYRSRVLNHHKSSALA